SSGYVVAHWPVMKKVTRSPAARRASRIAGVGTPEAPQSKVRAISGRLGLPRTISPAGRVMAGAGVGGMGVGLGMAVGSGVAEGASGETTTGTVAAGVESEAFEA